MRWYWPSSRNSKLLKQHQLSIDDIDLWEINEALLCRFCIVKELLGIDPKKLNVNGGSIAIAILMV